MSRRAHTDGLPSLLNGNMLLEYKRYQKSSKSSRSVREKIIHEKPNSKKVESSNFGHACTFHGESLDFYCYTHKEPVCMICATTMHKVCNMVTVNENAMRSAHVCVNLNEVEQTIETVIENMEKIKLDREENLLKLLMQKNTIEKELHNTRKKMNERLDRLEKDILGQLNANYRRLKSEMDHVLKDLDYRKQGVKTLQNALAKAKNIETEVELLLEGKRIEKKVNNEEKYVCNFYNDDSIKQIDIEFKLNPIINSFIVDIKSFGDISVRKSPSRVNLTRTIHKQNLMDGIHLTRHVNHIKLRLKEKTYKSTGKHDINSFPQLYNNTLRRQNTM